MQTNRSNRPRLEDVRHIKVGEIAQLPAELLALLHDDAAAALESAKLVKDWLDGAIALRYADRARAFRQAESKDTGTVRFEDGDVTVVADLPKRIDWDQAQLAELVERIRAAGDDPADFVDISFKVLERKFSAWPENVRAAFAPARTVRIGKQTFRLEPKEPR